MGNYTTPAHIYNSTQDEKLSTSRTSMFHRLRDDLSGMLGKHEYNPVILIEYEDGGEKRTEVGIAYSLSNQAIEIGSYFKDSTVSLPKDYNKRKRRIPIHDIIDYNMMFIHV